MICPGNICTQRVTFGAVVPDLSRVNVQPSCFHNIMQNSPTYDDLATLRRNVGWVSILDITLTGCQVVAFMKIRVGGPLHSTGSMPPIKRLTGCHIDQPSVNCTGSLMRGGRRMVAWP